MCGFPLSFDLSLYFIICSLGKLFIFTLIDIDIKVKELFQVSDNRIMKFI